MKRRTIEVFSLSFLDCICCGFGALILLFVLVNASKKEQRRVVVQDLSSEVSKVERLIVEGQRNRVEARNTLEKTKEQLLLAQGRSETILREVESNRVEIARYQNQTLATRESVNKLKADLKSLEEGKKRLEAGGPAKEDGGDKVAKFPGEGDRHYLTGVKMGGQRVLILVDASASMLSDKLVDIIRLRNLPEAQRRNAPKWRQGVRTVEWLVAQLPVEAQFQVYTFHETAQPLLADAPPGWLEVKDAARLNAVMPAMRALVPDGGTSLARAFEAAKALKPAPDNIFLLTDGLPTQGAGRRAEGKVSGSRRLKLFNDALEIADRGVPMNILLFPMEGDPLAASAFWRLATRTRGSMLCPSEDWP
jgi:hypothetical protein